LKKADIVQHANKILAFSTLTTERTIHHFIDILIGIYRWRDLTCHWNNGDLTLFGLMFSLEE